MIHMLSLGAGVQSTTLALMAKDGLIKPMPEFAVFSDTKWESEETYRHLQWLCGVELVDLSEGRIAAVPGEYQSGVLPFPVHVVSAGDIFADHIDKADTRTTMPFRLNDGDELSRARQKCTSDYKAVPIEKKMKEVIRERGLSGHILPKEPVISQWRGISLDEVMRLKPASEPWYQTRFPLAMELRIRRGECEKWRVENGYRVPQRSACIGCPNHDNNEWRLIKQRPKEWAQAILIDKRIRKAGGLDMPAFLHSDGVPLEDADLSKSNTVDAFNNDCLGMCGV
jgi:hypothetical protein